ncbi:Fe-S protein assembly co-chaperone HscB [Conchiformibius steedae DSM 2580]|uniref:Co-chaperone protein HscB homolog n=1 Tax=Conchiformibius steedae DSM 2580 TaxID=1121352 RepID=A0AAE9HWC4_9NEIS|nr:Fe-S protein assembly co-chaperone HscB [Conchiformibius steedae]QMT32829.1 Fe-S protein assembly co-chaperone HscB [Conchiformibius steedae]URD67440.1 Fe-S protein assembly co-chaperone HscB [Conchiformibius steedae DSM 2580]
MPCPFTLFGLPEQFPLDETALDTRYRELAAQFHPDRAAAASAFEQKQAVMMSAAVNEAYRVLRHPLERAAYLLQKQNIDADAPEHTHFAPEFLMQQMAWREQLAEADDSAAIQALQAEIAAAYHELLAQLHSAFAAEQYEAAAQLLRQGRFLDKMLKEIKNTLPDS